MSKQPKESWVGSGGLIQDLAGVIPSAPSDVTGDDEKDADSIIATYKTGEAKAPRFTDTHIRKTYHFKREHHRRLVRMSKELNKSISAILGDALIVFFDFLDHNRISPRYYRRLTELSEQLGKSPDSILEEALQLYLNTQNSQQE